MFTIAGQRQLPCTGIGHVAGDIEKIFSQPNNGSCYATRIGSAMEMPCGGKRENKLKQRAAIDSRTRAENAHQWVACFVHCQVRAVENREPTFRAKPMKTQAGDTKGNDNNKSAERN